MSTAQTSVSLDPEIADLVARARTAQAVFENFS